MTGKAVGVTLFGQSNCADNGLIITVDQSNGAGGSWQVTRDLRNCSCFYTPFSRRYWHDTSRYYLWRQCHLLSSSDRRHWDLARYTYPHAPVSPRPSYTSRPVCQFMSVPMMGLRVSTVVTSGVPDHPTLGSGEHEDANLSGRAQADWCIF